MTGILQDCAGIDELARAALPDHVDNGQHHDREVTLNENLPHRSHARRLGIWHGEPRALRPAPGPDAGFSNKLVQPRS